MWGGRQDAHREGEALFKSKLNEFGKRPDGMSGGSGSTRSSLNHFTAGHGPPAGHHDDEERGTMKKGQKRGLSREG